MLINNELEYITLTLKSLTTTRMNNSKVILATLILRSPDLSERTYTAYG
jgi:hypothetical protein